MSKIRGRQTANQPGYREPQAQDLAQINIKEWKKAAKDRQLRVLISGLGGVGKSTLINQLLRLKKDGEPVKEGRGGGATTLIVSKHEKTTEQGMKVCVFDTPGFGDIDIEDKDIVTMMERETEKTLDVVFYCISLSGPCRVQRADVQAIKIITQAFGGIIWKKAVIVLTFANTLEAKVSDEAEYKTIIAQIQEKVRRVLGVLEDPHINEEIIAQLPIVTAGHSEPTLKYEAEECESLGGWDNRLFLKALEQVDPEITPNLLETRYSWNFLVATSTAGSVVSAAGITTAAGSVACAAGSSIAGAINPGLGYMVGSAFAAYFSGSEPKGVYAFIMAIIRIIMRKYQEWLAGRELAIEQ